jgi:carboxyl-terminal processing protease
LYTPSGRRINRPRTDDDDDSDDDALRTLGADTTRPQFHTDAGRVVLGGGGITPDVPVSDSAESAAAAELQAALGKHVADFRDVLTDYALDLKGKGAVTTAGFTVTPAMRNDLYERLRKRDVTLPRSVFDDNAQLIDRLIGDQVARYVFGPEAEFERSTKNDQAIATAVRLLQGASTPPALLKEASKSR